MKTIALDRRIREVKQLLNAIGREPLADEVFANLDRLENLCDAVYRAVVAVRRRDEEKKETGDGD